ncbi:MAG: cytidine deaminase [SAR324 cluster bacterium]|uniref:Cytidine deaminase n=1 Tax=SAR324 cluster bacterium TaxID=2024889 RepID=A0A7X9FQE9_9DELT|nr:cytidine deaminase [SAR324 cluster bacterium]
MENEKPERARSLKSLELTQELLSKLKDTARSASRSSYSPYSNFKVGAAVLTSKGKIYSGCNIENASYGLTNCAERTAIFKAVSEGESDILAVVVYTPTENLSFPCGACRQVLNEFGPDCLVVSIGNGEREEIKYARELLPDSFGPKDLGK